MVLYLSPLDPDHSSVFRVSFDGPSHYNPELGTDMSMSLSNIFGKMEHTYI